MHTVRSSLRARPGERRPGPGPGLLLGCSVEIAIQISSADKIPAGARPPPCFHPGPASQQPRRVVGRGGARRPEHGGRSSMGVLLGVDGGGTKTLCVCLDRETGEERGRERSRRADRQIRQRRRWQREGRWPMLR